MVNTATNFRYWLTYKSPRDIYNMKILFKSPLTIFDSMKISHIVICQPSTEVPPTAAMGRHFSIQYISAFPASVLEV